MPFHCPCAMSSGGQMWSESELFLTPSLRVGAWALPQEASHLRVPSSFSDAQWLQPAIFHLGFFYGIFQNQLPAGEQQPALSWEASAGRSRQGV